MGNRPPVARRRRDQQQDCRTAGPTAPPAGRRDRRLSASTASSCGWEPPAPQPLPWKYEGARTGVPPRPILVATHPSANMGTAALMAVQDDRFDSPAPLVHARNISEARTSVAPKSRRGTGRPRALAASPQARRAAVPSKGAGGQGRGLGKVPILAAAHVHTPFSTMMNGRPKFKTGCI